MADKITELVDTLQRLEQLLLRYELDIAGGQHLVDYQPVIQQLCSTFEQAMLQLISGHGSIMMSRSETANHSVSRSIATTWVQGSSSRRLDTEDDAQS